MPSFPLIIVAERRHGAWYAALFGPAVRAGLVGPAALAGHRDGPVSIRGSRHVPPRAEAVADGMRTWWRLLREEESPTARAVLAHWLLGYIHPWFDGNGRFARFLMNLLLVGAGHPWTVIRVERREAYLAALERASVDGDAGPFAEFIAGEMGVGGG